MTLQSAYQINEDKQPALLRNEQMGPNPAKVIQYDDRKFVIQFYLCFLIFLTDTHSKVELLQTFYKYLAYFWPSFICAFEYVPCSNFKENDNMKGKS